MEISHLSTMQGGWFVGDFSPAVVRTRDFEACVKRYSAGDFEEPHFQRTATELTVIIEGSARLGESKVHSGDIITIPPHEVAGFEALTDVVLIAIKFPSIPADKVLANG